jgi:hypothetical protein
MTSTQFGRSARLILGQSEGNRGLDLSQLRFTFRTVQNDADSPNQCYVTIYNIAPQNVNKALKKYNTISVDAGYEQSRAHLHGQHRQL